MKYHYHRTYYELQSWNKEEIKKSGLKKGSEVWFPHFEDAEVRKGKIKKFSVDIEGDTMVEVEWEEECERVLPAGWTSVEGEDNPEKKVHKWNEKNTYELYFNRLANSREDALKILRSMFEFKISGHKAQIAYFEKKLKGIK
jgi:hypothetical protein